jgi:hypothetical protein|tara:strand:- start:72 stop:266 length:195 start_codon:yes stop_codon:yes gene_type:complete
MQAGDLVTMPGSIEPITGIILQADGKGVVRGTVRSNRVKVYWIEDAEASWEPKKWLEVINAASR